MAEIRFAEFFVSQLLGKRRADLDLHHLKSYDPAIYKHLKNLRSLTADELAALELDFSVIVDDVGDVQSVDLVSGGRNIRVTVDNRLEYIRAYVNFFLFKRIEPLVDAMRAGLSTVIDPGWLAMFSPSELQTLVSGADADLDVDDMMKHCAVHNIRGKLTYEADRNYMDLFWSVVGEMSAEDKRGLLK
ncbi:HECT-domain protein [Cooperia oncophora]